MESGEKSIKSFFRLRVIVRTRREGGDLDD